MNNEIKRGGKDRTMNLFNVGEFENNAKTTTLNLIFGIDSVSIDRRKETGR